MNKSFRAALDMLHNLEAAARTFNISDEVLEERMLDLAIAAAKDTAKAWETDETLEQDFPKGMFKPRGKSILLVAWGWYIPRHRKHLQTPAIEYISPFTGESSYGYLSNGKIV